MWRISARGGSFSCVVSESRELAVAAVATTVAGGVWAEAIVPLITESVSSGLRILISVHHGCAMCERAMFRGFVLEFGGIQSVTGDSRHDFL